MGQEAGAVWRPAVGERVDSYHLEEKLGEGGFGAVYRARRGGRLSAVKFLSLAATDEWGWRELEVLLRLRQVGGVTLEGHGKWPVETPSHLYIAMEYVRGRTLYEWAEETNPTARQVAELLVPLARYLAEVHAKGVAHRDVKGENILVREDGRPVLVDFGVGTYEGAVEVTGWRVPGTRAYQSPEAIRFMRQRRGEERYPPRPGDDVWALGVVLYKLLTDAKPFEGPFEGELAESILTHTPEPPHERNPRVPEALSKLCVRLLEKKPRTRLRGAKALGKALEAVLASADAAWDVPLCEAYTPDNVTTPRGRRFPLELEAEVARMERLRGYARRPPRRGPRPPRRESSAEPPPPPWRARRPRTRAWRHRPPPRRRESRPLAGDAWPGGVPRWGCCWGSWPCWRWEARGPSRASRRPRLPVRKWRAVEGRRKVTRAQRPLGRQPLRPSPARRSRRWARRHHRTDSSACGRSDCWTKQESRPRSCFPTRASPTAAGRSSMYVGPSPIGLGDDWHWNWRYGIRAARPGAWGVRSWSAGTARG